MLHSSPPFAPFFDTFPQGVFLNDPCALLASIWVRFASLLVPFWIPFGSLWLAFGPQISERTFWITFSKDPKTIPRTLAFEPHRPYWPGAESCRMQIQ